MNSNEIFEKEYDTCNKFVLRSFFSIVFFTLIVYFLNVAGIFVVKSQAMTLLTVFSLVYFIFMYILYKLMRKKYYGKLYFAYLSSTIILTYVGIMYSFLTFHVILLLVFPAILFNIYGNKKLIMYVTIGTVIMMILSHYASFYYGVNPEEPFTTMQTILVFGLLPKLIIFAAFMYVFIFVGEHNNKMVQSLSNYSKDMYLTQEEMVKAFAEISESKSGQTGQHVKRVSKYVEIMANHLEINSVEKQSLVIASMMHDVGKLSIPAEILDKKGKLTDEEFSIVKKHTQFGYDLLKNSPGRTMEIASDIALNHHERWDGKGYGGYKGESISLYSRIMAIADVFDALVSKRSYKEKWDPQDAYDEIVKQSGTQFDPQLVELFKICYPEFVQVLKEMPE